jgi:hypothetical protein
MSRLFKARRGVNATGAQRIRNAAGKTFPRWANWPRDVSFINFNSNDFIGRSVALSLGLA